MKILLAEDDRTSRKVLAKTLSQWGYDVISTANGQEAWEQMQAEKPSIAILDWEMPVMDGLAVVDKIRLTKYEHYVFILLLTAKSEKQDVIKGIESGADDYLTKPFDRGELLARLRAGQRIIELEKSLANKNAQLSEVNQILAQANERMKNDLDAAAEIQKSLLPNKVPQIENVRIEWFLKPCDELAGDILNVFMLDKNHLGFYLLDVSGHGVGAALLSVTLSRILSPLPDESSILRNKVKGSDTYKITPPAEVAEKLNKQFFMKDESGQYFTFIYGILNLKTLTYRFISAGHPNSILFKNNNSSVAFQNAGLPIGFLEDVEYEEHHIQLKSGDRLYFYSDGINEAMNAENDQFGHERLIDTFESLKNQNLKTCLDSTIEKVNNWSQYEVKDDMSILAIELV